MAQLAKEPEASEATHPAYPANSAGDSQAGPAPAAAPSHSDPSAAANGQYAGALDGRATPHSGMGGSHRMGPPPHLDPLPDGDGGPSLLSHPNGGMVGSGAGHQPTAARFNADEDGDNPFPSDDSSSSQQQEAGRPQGGTAAALGQLQEDHQLHAHLMQQQQQDPMQMHLSRQQAAPPPQARPHLDLKPPSPTQSPDSQALPQNGRRVPSARLAKRPRSSATLKALQESSEEEDAEAELLPHKPSPSIHRPMMGPAQGLLQQAGGKGQKRGHPLDAGYPLQLAAAATAISGPSSAEGWPPSAQHIPRRRRSQCTRKTSRLGSIVATIRSFAQGPPRPATPSDSPSESQSQEMWEARAPKRQRGPPTDRNSRVPPSRPNRVVGSRAPTQMGGDLPPIRTQTKPNDFRHDPLARLDSPLGFAGIDGLGPEDGLGGIFGPDMMGGSSPLGGPLGGDPFDLLPRDDRFGAPMSGGVGGRVRSGWDVAEPTDPQQLQRMRLQQQQQQLMGGPAFMDVDPAAFNDHLPVCTFLAFYNGCWTCTSVATNF